MKYMLLWLAMLGVLSGGCASLSNEPQSVPHQVVSAKRVKVEKALKTLPEMTVRDYEALGDQYRQQGNVAMAFLQYDKALRLEPNQLEVQRKKGTLLFQNGSRREAIQLFQRILEADSGYAMAHESLGEAYLSIQQHEQAEIHCQKATELNTILWNSYNCLGMIYDQQQRFQNAIAVYQQAIKLQPQRGMLFNNLGLSYYAQQKYEDAIQNFKIALALEKENSRVYNNLGFALSKVGRYQEALDAFAQGGQKAQAYNNIGVIYMAEGQYQLAVSSFEKAILLNSTYYETASQNLILARRALARTRPLTGDSQIVK